MGGVFPWFSLATKKITSLTGPRWTNLLQIWKSQGLVFRKFHFRIMVGPERKLKMITQVSTSKHRSWMHLTYGFLRTSLVQHCLARLQPFSIEGRVCKECPAKWLGGLNIRPKGPNVMLIKLLFRDVSLRTFAKNVLLNGDDLHLKRLSWIEMPANSRKVEISRQPAVWNSAKFQERWESWCCDIKLVFWIFCEKMLPVLSTRVFCPFHVQADNTTRLRRAVQQGHLQTVQRFLRVEEASREVFNIAMLAFQSNLGDGNSNMFYGIIPKIGEDSRFD